MFVHLTRGHWREGTVQKGTSLNAYIVALLVTRAQEGHPTDLRLESLWNGKS